MNAFDFKIFAWKRKLSNLLFTRHNNYIINDTVENIKLKANPATKQYWFDFSENIQDETGDDNTFKFNSNSSLNFDLFGMPQAFAYLFVKIQQARDGVSIQIKTRPNYVILATFYFFVSGTFINLFGILTNNDNNSVENLCLFAVFAILVAGLMISTTVLLKKRFEKSINLKPDKTYT